LKLLVKYFLVVFLSLHSFPQVSNGVDSVRFLRNTEDNLKIFNPFRETTNFQPFLLYDSGIKKLQIIVPKYSFKSSRSFHPPNLSLNGLSEQSLWINPEDELKSFKISLNILREMEYESLIKYDLGELGKYLGLSRNIMAVILAIISLLKN